MCRRGRSTRGERGCRCGVRAVRRVAVLGGQRCECGSVGAEGGDLERRRRSGFELALEREVPLGIHSCPGLGVAERGERVLPDAAVGVRELHRALADRVRLGRDSRRLVPPHRAARDHRDEPGRERNGERCGRASTRREPVRRQALEKLAQPQFQVFAAHAAASLRGVFPRS